MADDRIDHPDHYASSTVECIEVIEAAGWAEGFNRGNAIKYIWRAGKKGDELEDLRKARWYLDREIARLGMATDRRRQEEKQDVR
jgi:hypothetical protein